MSNTGRLESQASSASVVLCDLAVTSTLRFAIGSGFALALRKFLPAARDGQAPGSPLPRGAAGATLRTAVLARGVAPPPDGGSSVT